MKGLLSDLLGPPVHRAPRTHLPAKISKISKEDILLGQLIKRNSCTWHCPHCNIEIFTVLPVVRCPACKEEV